MQAQPAYRRVALGERNNALNDETYLLTITNQFVRGNSLAYTCNHFSFQFFISHNFGRGTAAFH